MADTLDLKSSVPLERAGSSPVLGTNKQDGFGRPILLFSKICDIIYMIKEKEIKNGTQIWVTLRAVSTRS